MYSSLNTEDLDGGSDRAGELSSCETAEELPGWQLWEGV